MLVSAAISPMPGRPARDIMDQARAGTYTLLVSDFMVWKLASVLRYPRIWSKYPHFTEEVVRAYAADVARLAETVREQTVLTEADGASRDPEDNRILAAAADGKTDYIVTRNTTHFPETFRGIKILTPETFLDLLRAQDNTTGGKE